MAGIFYGLYKYFLLMDLNMAIKQLRLLSVHLLEFSKRIPDKASIFTAELEAIVSALPYSKSTTTRKRQYICYF